MISETVSRNSSPFDFFKTLRAFESCHRNIIVRFLQSTTSAPIRPRRAYLFEKRSTASLRHLRWKADVQGLYLFHPANHPFSPRTWPFEKVPKLQDYFKAPKQRLQYKCCTFLMPRSSFLSAYSAARLW